MIPNSDEALLPCPHCGGEVTLFGAEATGYFVSCSTRYCYGFNCAKFGYEETRNAWNRRELCRAAPAGGDLEECRRHSCKRKAALRNAAPAGGDEAVGWADPYELMMLREHGGMLMVTAQAEPESKRTAPLYLRPKDAAPAGSGEDCPDCKGAGEVPCPESEENALGMGTCILCGGTGYKTDLFAVARDLGRIIESEALDADALDVHAAILRGAYELEEARAALLRKLQQGAES